MLTDEEKQELKHHIEIDTAELNGATIQFKRKEAGCGAWFDTATPKKRDWYKNEYRVKPIKRIGYIRIGNSQAGALTMSTSFLYSKKNRVESLSGDWTACVGVVIFDSAPDKDTEFEEYKE